MKALWLTVLLLGCGTVAPVVDAGVVDSGSVDSGSLFSAEELKTLKEMSPAALPGPITDITNKYADNPMAALLGQKFFFDPGFSGALLDGDNDGTPEALGRAGEVGKVSCAGCHVADAGFLDNRTLGKQISLAAGWTLRRTPSLLDVGHAKLLMWDGRRDTLYGQVFGPIESRDEMNTSRLFVAQQIFARYRAEYQAVFGAMPPLNDTARFPALTAQKTGCRRIAVKQYECHGNPGDAAEYDGLSAADKDAVTRVIVNFGKAIGAFERRLNCGQGRFDRWVNGDAAALTASEQRGVKVFLGKGQCATCHSGPFFSDQQFHNVGLKAELVAVVFIDSGDVGAAGGLMTALSDPLNSKGVYSDGDDGRLPAVVAPSMAGAFRTPALRCVAQRPSFMHTAQLKTLESVVSFFDQGGHPFGFEGTNELKALNLTETEQTDLVAFLRTLDGPGPAAALLGPPQ